MIIPANADPALLSMLGAMSSANQAIINKDQAGNYNVTFHLSEQSLTNGSYLQAMQTSSNVNKSNIGVTGKWKLDGSRWRYYQNGYFRSSGELLTNNWKQGKDGKWYFCGKNGAMATSRIID